jgi:hypothetical protein
MFFTIFIMAFILGTIRPFLHTFTMLLIFDPLTNVSSSISMLVGSVSMSFIVAPRSFVDVTIGMD